MGGVVESVHSLNTQNKVYTYISTRKKEEEEKKEREKQKQNEQLILLLLHAPACLSVALTKTSLCFNKNKFCRKIPLHVVTNEKVFVETL